LRAYGFPRPSEHKLLEYAMNLPDRVRGSLFPHPTEGVPKPVEQVDRGPKHLRAKTLDGQLELATLAEPRDGLLSDGNRADLEVRPGKAA
jgi:hypothetical protein